MLVNPKQTIAVLVFNLSILLIVGFLLPSHVGAANDNEAKARSAAGYSHLIAKIENQGTARIIVQVRAPFATEPLLANKIAHEQRSIIFQAQNQLLTELAESGHKPNQIYKYKYVPYLAMSVDGSTLEALLSSKNVVSISEDILLRRTLAESVPRIGATQLHAGNLTGSGFAVAIVDDGVDKTHPFLHGSVVSEACYSTDVPEWDLHSACPGGLNETTADDSAMPYGGNCPSGQCFHGTAMAGIVAGRSGVMGSPGPGVAPGASIIAIKTDVRCDPPTCDPPLSTGLFSDSIKGLERVYELRNKYSIAAVNMSWGGYDGYTGYCDWAFPVFVDIVNLLRAAGIAPIAASGNNSGCINMVLPACFSSVISVGATDDDDAVSWYTNVGFILKLMAPGSSITSSIPVADGGGYASGDGTSHATAHVSGAWAVMKQAYPAATVDDILGVFTATGLTVVDQHPEYPDCPVWSKQRINVYEAYQLMGFSADVTIGSILNIDASNFGTKKGKVLIGNYPTKILSWTNNSITAVVNKVLPTNSAYDLTIKRQPFKWIPPFSIMGSINAKNLELDPLTVNHAPVGQEIIITGKFFGTKKGKIYLEDLSSGQVKKCKVSKWFMDPFTGASDIKFVVPKIDSGKEYVLKVSNKVGATSTAFRVD